MIGVAVERKRGQRRDARRQPGQIFGARIGQTGQSGHHRGAVHDRQRFLRPQAQGRDAGFGERLPPPASWRRRARLRPRRTTPRRDKTAASDRRWRRPSLRMESAAAIPRCSKRTICSSNSTLTPEKPLHSDVRRVAITARVCAAVEILAQAAAVKGVKMARQLGDQFRLDASPCRNRRSRWSRHKSSRLRAAGGRENRRRGRSPRGIPARRTKSRAPIPAAISTMSSMVTPFHVEANGAGRGF